MKAVIALEDGAIFDGQGFGAEGVQVGEVVFNTSMTGYQELLTDPSYHRQIVVCTVPHVGNTGINLDDEESTRIWVAGFAVRDLSPNVSNYRAQKTLDDYLKSSNVIGISNVETRALVRRLRTQGVMRGVIASGAAAENPQALIEQARAWSGMDNLDLTGEVTCAAPYVWEEAADPQWYVSGEASQRGERGHIVAYDFGIKTNQLRLFTSRGFRVTVVPARTSYQEVLALKPDGVFLSNGPGDPSAVTYAIENTRALLGKCPIFGICLGHQILALALGAKTHKLLFGHRGGNQPVIDPEGRVTITVHNHGFAVTPGTLPENAQVTRINLNDNCIEGLKVPELHAFSVQYHPEAAPGPHDALDLFDEFVAVIDQTY
ncbi:MAG: glutamine-hydrolyzing carbamoyl-phosphate synthase small subunit [Anaerolineae bacterium]